MGCGPTSPRKSDEYSSHSLSNRAVKTRSSSSDFRGDVGPQPTAFYFEPDHSFETVGEIKAVASKRKKDRVWETEVSYFTQKAEFRQRIRLLKPDYRVTGVIKGQLCSEKNGVCVPFERLFLF